MTGRRKKLVTKPSEERSFPPFLSSESHNILKMFSDERHVARDKYSAQKNGNDSILVSIPIFAFLFSVIFSGERDDSAPRVTISVISRGTKFQWKLHRITTSLHHYPSTKVDFMSSVCLAVLLTTSRYQPVEVSIHFI